MDLLYGNDGISYRVLASSGGISRQAERLLLQNYTSYRFPEKKNVFSSPEDEPKSIYYQSTDLNGLLEKIYIVIAKTGRMWKFSAPSSYAHIHLEKAGTQFYRQDFFKIFNYHLLEDKDIPKYQDKSDFHPDVSIGNKDVTDRNYLTKEQIRAVLYNFFYKERLGRPVRIILDAEGDRYNERSREVLATIYRYLPYDIRKRFGFVSYTAEGQTQVGRMGFQIYDKELLRRPNDMDLDLSDFNLDIIRNRINKAQITDYADYLAGLTWKELEEHFDLLDKITEGKSVSISDCASYHAYAVEWKEKPVEELFSQWVRYYADNSLRGGGIFKSLMNTVSDRLSEEPYRDYVSSRIEKGLAANGYDVFGLSREMQQLIRFADGVDSAQFNEELTEKITELISRELSKEPDIENQIRKEKNVCDALEKLHLGKKFDRVLASVLEIQKKNLLEMEKNNRQMKEERKRKELAAEDKRVEERFRRRPSLNKKEEGYDFRQFYTSLQTDAAREKARKYLLESMKSSIRALEESKNLPTARQIEGTRTCITVLSEVFGKKTTNQFNARLDEIQDRLEFQNSSLSLNTPSDLVAFIEGYTRRQCLVEGANFPLDPVMVTFGAIEEPMTEEQCRILARFIICPSDAAVNNFGGCIDRSRNRGLIIRHLMRQGFLSADKHKEPLLFLANQWRDNRLKSDIERWQTDRQPDIMKEQPIQDEKHIKKERRAASVLDDDLDSEDKKNHKEKKGWFPFSRK